MEPSNQIDTHEKVAKTYIIKKYSEIFSSICEILKSKALLRQNKNDQFRIWLYLCLAKTLKEQTGITDSLPRLDK